jgi:hypothetical protein
MQDATSMAQAYRVDLRRISTPREHCLMVTVGGVDLRIVARAEAERFDQLPVLDETGSLCGLVPVEHVRGLLDAGQELKASDPAIFLGITDAHPPLLSLLGALAHHRALVFWEEDRDSEDFPADDWFGMVTLSDLNRHPFRADLYPILAELEASLAELIDRQFDDPWSWLLSMGEDSQVRVIGRWELEIRNSVDTSPIAGAMLTDMLRIASKSKEIRELLGFSSASQVEKAVGSIPTLRNQIMHPVRPLALSREDVNKLSSVVQTVVQLTERVIAANATLAQRGFDSRRLLP